MLVFEEFLIIRRFLIFVCFGFASFDWRDRFGRFYCRLWVGLYLLAAVLGLVEFGFWFTMCFVFFVC